MNPRIEFTAPIVREYSYLPTLEELGEGKCSMELYMNENGKSGNIEWIIEYEDGDDDVEHIGVNFDNTKTLIDYDGVFTLPAEAIKLLRQAGYHVPKDFENQIIKLQHKLKLNTTENLTFSHEQKTIHEGKPVVLRIFKNKEGHKLTFTSNIEDKVALDLVTRWYASKRLLKESLGDYEAGVLGMKYWNCNDHHFHLWNASLSMTVDFLIY